MSEQIEKIKRDLEKSQREIDQASGQLTVLEKQKNDYEQQLIADGVDMDDPEKWIEQREKQLADQIEELTGGVVELQQSLSKINA